jgi:hypothetical protein
LCNARVANVRKQEKDEAISDNIKRQHQTWEMEKMEKRKNKRHLANEHQVRKRPTQTQRIAPEMEITND